MIYFNFLCSLLKNDFVAIIFQGNVVMLARSDGEDDNDDEGDVEGPERLLKGLTHQCSLSLHVEGLPTGFCRDIHGQVCQVDGFKLQLKI